jgi:hypothetical protein
MIAVVTALLQQDGYSTSSQSQDMALALALALAFFFGFSTFADAQGASTTTGSGFGAKVGSEMTASAGGSLIISLTYSCAESNLGLRASILSILFLI